MLKAFKYRLLPNDSQKELLEKHFGCCRFIYNLGIEVKQMAYSGAKVNVSCYDLMRQVTQLKKEYAWLTEVESKSLNQTLFDLDKAFSGFFKQTKKFPKFKSKSGRQSFRSQDPRYIKIKDGGIRLPKFKTPIKFIQDRPLVGSIRSATTSKTATGKYFISILCETGVEKIKPKPIDKSTSIGIDLGIKHFLVTSDGREVDNPKFLRNSMVRLKVLQRRLSRKKKGSANRSKARRKVALLHEKIVNQRKDFLHKLSSQLVSDNQTICCETLRIKNMVKNHNLAQSINDAGWGMFIDMLKYKSDWYGVNLLQIPTFEASTKVCNVCEVTNETLTLKDRGWLCASCGTLHHRDVNAAKVIKNYCIKNSGGASTIEPVESLTIVGAMKQEVIN